MPHHLVLGRLAAWARPPRDHAAGLAEVFDASQWKERWWFKEVLDHVDRGPDAVPAAAASLTNDAGQVWATLMVGAVREDTRSPSAAVTAPPQFGARHRRFERVEGSVPALPSRLTHRLLAEVGGNPPA